MLHLIVSKPYYWLLANFRSKVFKHFHRLRRKGTFLFSLLEFIYNEHNSLYEI